MARIRQQYSTLQHGLPGLPLDIHLEIFWWLSCISQDVLSYGSTCEAIFHVFKKFLFVQYKRSLDKQGLRDNPHCDLPIEARWALLLDRTRTWFELDLEVDCDVPPVVGVLDVNNVALSPVAFVANFTRSPADKSELLIQWLQFPYQVADPSGNLSFEEGDCDSPVRLHSSMQNLKMIGIGSAVFEHNSCIIVIQADDPAYPEVSAITVWKHDRLCAAENTGRMDLELPLDATISRVAVEGAGENLAITFQYSLRNASQGEEGGAVFPRLLVVDWKKFRTKLEINACEQVSDPGLVFLSEELLLNPSSSSCVLNIYSILPATAFENGTADPSKQPICSLGLPPLERGNYISVIDCKCSPNPTTQDAFPRHVPKSMPFTEDPKQAIVVFAITVRGNDASKEWKFRMVVHRRALLELVQQNLADTSNSSRPRVIPWNDWGPCIVRWLDPLSGALPPSWGQRIFELDNHTLHVLNFNPKEIETLSSDMFSEASHTPTVQKPGSDIFPHEGAFKGKLIGSLPCIRQKVRTEVEADSAWFDGVRLMYKRASKDPKGQNCKLTINSLYFG